MIERTRTCGALAALLIIAGCAEEGGAPAAAAPSDIEIAASQSAAAETAPARIEADVRYLADDALEGREAGTDAYRTAAEYVAARMTGLNLEPAGDDGWFQEVPLITSQAVVDAAALSITGPDGQQTELTNLEDFRLYTPSDADSFSLENAPAVFVGYGVYAPDSGHNDLEGLDLEGKVVVYFGGAPDTFQSEERAHFGSGSQKFNAFSDRGAIGYLALRSEGDMARSPWERVIANPNSISMTWLWPDGRPDRSGPNIEGGGSIHPDASGCTVRRRAENIRGSARRSGRGRRCAGGL